MKTLPPSSRRQSGFALLLTLGSVVLLSGLILAFLSRARMNSQVSHSNTNIVKADLLARSALDIVTGELRAEIADTSRSTKTSLSATNTLYVPTTASALPARLGLSPSTSTGPIVKVSASGVPIRPTGTIQGSAVTIDTASLNGRSVSSSTWFTSSTTSPQLGSNAVMPTWLLFTRGNGVTTPSVSDAANTANKNYVVGRFAYTVYDVGGLLDANVAGYNPLSAETNNVAFKSAPAHADLTQLGISAATLSKFVSWRNVATGTDTNTFQEWATGLPRATGSASSAALAAAQSGHREIAYGDNVALSRHDLLKNTSLSLSGTTAASLLTHFSRTLSAPSTTSANLLTSANPSLPAVTFSVAASSVYHYKDDGTYATYAAAAGDTLLQRRFSLAKLAWITPSGPSSTAFNASLTTAQKIAAIQSCFGLQWTTLTVGGVATPCWNYVGSVAGAATPSAIETLAQVAAEGREPNFFEMLKAGITAKSVGVASALATYAEPDQANREGQGDLQLLRIGANLIDSANPYNYPTTLALKATVTSTGGTATGPIPVHGVKDLPYFHGMFLNSFWSTTCSSTSVISISGVNTTVGNDVVNYCALAAIPILFNPHQNNVANSGTPPNIRIRIANGTVTAVMNIGATNANPVKAYPNLNLPTNTAEIRIASANYAAYQSHPKPVVGPEASTYGTTELGSLLSSPFVVDSTSGASLLNGFVLWKQSTPTASVTSLLRGYFKNLLFVLEYQDPANPANWYVYDTMAGNEGLLQTATGTGIGDPTLIPATTSGTANIDFGGSLPALTTPGVTAVRSLVDDLSATGYGLSTLMAKWDPRTTRFGGCAGQQVNSSSTSLFTLPVPASSTLQRNGGLRGKFPFTGSVSGNNDLYPAMWTEGNKDASVNAPWNFASGNTISNVADNDGTLRPADGWLGTNHAANLYYNLATNALRPLILQRPLRSVAELGYAFRDSPWKTLNFFDATSGDAALLDLFSLSDEPPVTAGRVNLNTNQPLVLQSLLNGTGQAHDGTLPLLASGANTYAKDIAAAYTGYALTSGTPTANLPLNPSQFVAFMSSAALGGAYSTTLNPIKTYRESVVRAFADTTQTRTWNLLVDVVAQTGHYPKTATSLNNFLVEGEKRYWLSVAIDRYTGKIVDEQLEPATN